MICDRMEAPLDSDERHRGELLLELRRKGETIADLAALAHVNERYICRLLRAVRREIEREKAKELWGR